MSNTKSIAGLEGLGLSSGSTALETQPVCAADKPGIGARLRNLFGSFVSPKEAAKPRANVEREDLQEWLSHPSAW